MKGTIVVSGAIAQRPGRGGHTWAFLQYVLGLRELGWDVLLVDRLDADMCVDASGQRCGIEESVNLEYFRSVVAGFQLDGSWSLLCDGGRRTIGLSRRGVHDRADRAALLLNVMGYLDDAEILARIENRVFLDIDPGFGQMWQESGLHRMFTGHRHYVTIGENIQRPECEIPSCGIDWITTPQPVALEHWPVTTRPPSRPFTSVISWRGPFGPVPFRGKTYGLRAHEFRRFLSLPGRTDATFELALDIHPSDEPDKARLLDNGWSLVEPRCVTDDPWSYQSYIQSSTGELMVAKNMYIESASGWFSDRSICYLASGRPVIAQDTGFGDRYPVGRGLVVFSSLEEAAEAADDICGNYGSHRRAAREIAVEYFNSRKVLPRLLAKVGVA